LTALDYSPLGALDENEQRYVEMGATPEQLNWRRYTIEVKCGGDVDKFMQEYPATPEEAFRASGSTVIEPNILSWHEKHCGRGERLILSRDPWGKIQVHPWPGQGPYLEVWKRPDEFRDYAFGGDVAEGMLSDAMDEHSDRDYSTAEVIDRDNKEQVAEWHGRMDEDLFGDFLCMLGEWYGWAWGGPEINTCGRAVLLAMQRRRYPNLYRTQVVTERVTTGGPSYVYGWRTQVNNRAMLINQYVSMCRPDPRSGWANRLLVHSAGLVEEERTFYLNKKGRAEHKPGFHDDRIFAMAIAIEVDAHSPRQFRHPGPPEIARPQTRRDLNRMLASVGAIDPGFDMEDELVLQETG